MIGLGLVNLGGYEKDSRLSDVRAAAARPLGVAGGHGFILSLTHLELEVTKIKISGNQRLDYRSFLSSPLPSPPLPALGGSWHSSLL